MAGTGGHSICKHGSCKKLNQSGYEGFCKSCGVPQASALCQVKPCRVRNECACVCNRNVRNLFVCVVYVCVVCVVCVCVVRVRVCVCVCV